MGDACAGLGGRMIVGIRSADARVPRHSMLVPPSRTRS
jgi:hypothetical protein